MSIRTLTRYFLHKNVPNRFIENNNFQHIPTRHKCDYDAIYEQTRDIFKCTLPKYINVLINLNFIYKSEPFWAVHLCMSSFLFFFSLNSIFVHFTNIKICSRIMHLLLLLLFLLLSFVYI